MNLGNTLVVAIILAICVVPFILMRQNRKKKEKQMLTSLAEIAKANNCEINNHEFCGDFVISEDKKLDFIFFFKHKKEENVLKYVNLNEIKRCSVFKDIKTLKNSNENESIIETVILKFIPKNKNKLETKFELFYEENTQLSGEIQLADSWSKKINNHLKIINN